MTDKAEIFYLCERPASSFPKEGSWHIDIEKSKDSVFVSSMSAGLARYETLIYNPDRAEILVHLCPGVKLHSIVIDRLHRYLMVDSEAIGQVEVDPKCQFSNATVLSAVEYGGRKQRDYFAGHSRFFDSEESLVDYERSLFSTYNAAAARRAVSSGMFVKVPPYDLAKGATLENIPFEIKNISAYRELDFMERSIKQVVADRLVLKSKIMPVVFGLFGLIYVRSDLVNICMKQRLPGLVPYGGARSVSLL
jgi:hypothetical protein